MTVADKMNAQVNTVMNMVFDKEPLSMAEAASAQGIVLQARHNCAILSVMFNQARDPEVKALIRESLEDQTRWTMETTEGLLSRGAAQLPTGHFSQRRLHDHELDIHADARLSDQEIILGLGAMAKASQSVLFAAMQASYQPEVSTAYRKILDSSFDFSYRLMQFTLNRGWLPAMPKVRH